MFRRSWRAPPPLAIIYTPQNERAGPGAGGDLTRSYFGVALRPIGPRPPESESTNHLDPRTPKITPNMGYNSIFSSPVLPVR